MEKYKHHKSEGWYIYFDENGLKTEFTKENRPGTYKKMMEWVADGNEIEPAETENEESARLLEEKKDALLKQEKTLLNLIIKNQYHLNTKRKKFIPDIPTWEISLDKWDDELDLVRGQIQLMNEGKSFSLITISLKPVFNS